MKKFIILTFITFLLVSCIDFTAPQRYKEAEYYLTGLLHQNEYVSLENPVMFGKTIATNGASLDDVILPEAQIKLYEIDWNQNIVDSTELVFSFNPFVPDEIGFIDQNQHLKIKNHFSYQIIAVYDQDTLRAETYVPDSIFIHDNSGYTADTLATGWTEMIFDTIEEDHPLIIETPNNDVINLQVEFYCLEEWYNAEYIFPFGDDFPEDEEEYENEADGGPRKTTIFYTFQPENNLINFGFYQYAFNFYGRYRVKVKSVDVNYLNYLYKPEGYNYGGINGGIGYFGSASCFTLYTKIIEE